MAYEVGSAYLSILPSLDGFGRTLSSQVGPQMRTAGADATGQLGQGMNSSQGKAGLGASAAILGKAFAIGFVVTAAADIAAGVKDYIGGALTGASDLAETINKSNTIFGEGADAINTWAETAATSVGLSRAAALDAASSFGNMFTQLGFASDEAAAMSVDVVQLSADLGSFNNLPTADVADKISAAFRGEYDSLQALIPTINAASVEQQALATTGKASADELTATEKAAAVLALVHRDGAAAAGDFAATSDGLANSQKILQANLTDVQNEIGTALLPVVTDLFRMFADEGIPIIQELAAWFTENQAAIRAFVVGAVDGGLLFIDVLLQMAAGYQMFMSAGLAVYDTLQTAMFSFVGHMLDGAAQAFGWIPGIGPKLEDARDNFHALEDSATANLDAIRAGAGYVTDQIGAARDGVADFRQRVQSLDGMQPRVSIALDLGLAEQRLAAFRARAQADIVITADLRAAGGYYAGRASGGPVVAGTPYIVGEREPELFVPNVSGTIYNQSQLAAMGRQGGGGNTGPIVEMSGNFYSYDPTGLGRAVARRVSDAMAVHGGFS